MKITLILAAAVLLSPSVAATRDFETIELMDLPDEIRHDMYLYILRNVDEIGNPAEARLVQRTPEAKYVTVRLKYGGPAAETVDGPGWWIICAYVELKREYCKTHYQAPRGHQGAFIDPPLPETREPLVPDANDI